MPVFWFMFKLIVLLYGTVWVRASVPRLRYDQLMEPGLEVPHRVGVPLGDGHRRHRGRRATRASDTLDIVLTGAGAAVGAIAVYFVLMACVPKRDEIEEIK